jgi:hypothetical protein
VLPVGQAPQDQRLGKLKDLNGYFPFTPPKAKAEWEERAAIIEEGCHVSREEAESLADQEKSGILG